MADDVLAQPCGEGGGPREREGERGRVFTASQVYGAQSCGFVSLSVCNTSVKMAEERQSAKPRGAGALGLVSVRPSPSILLVYLFFLSEILLLTPTPPQEGTGRTLLPEHLGKRGITCLRPVPLNHVCEMPAVPQAEHGSPYSSLLEILKNHETPGDHGDSWTRSPHCYLGEGRSSLETRGDQVCSNSRRWGSRRA